MTGEDATPGDAGDSAEPITVVLADDHQIVRDGIRMVLDAEPDIEVVAEAGTADDAARYVLGHKPRVLVLDLNMPGRSSLELIPEIRERSPETAVIVLTMQSEPAFARKAFSSGSQGYVVKHSAAKELVDAIRVVLTGETYINPQLGARVAAEPEETPTDELTPREREVLALLARGYMNPEIAERLVISVRTVETHRSNIQRKIGTGNRAELISYAVENGLVKR